MGTRRIKVIGVSAAVLAVTACGIAAPITDQEWLARVKRHAAPPAGDAGGTATASPCSSASPARPRQPLKPARVQVLRSHRQGVTAAPRDQRGIRAHQRAQPRQMRPQRPGRSRWRQDSPQILGQPLLWNRQSPRYEQQREHCAPFRAAQRKLPAISDRLHRSENA